LSTSYNLPKDCGLNEKGRHFQKNATYQKLGNIVLGLTKICGELIIVVAVQPPKFVIEVS